MELRLYPPDTRTRDLDNPLKLLWDSLTYAGVYGDDSQIDAYHVYRCQHTAVAYVEVTLEPYK
jgi:crossover junction endodeoxyribonuclease RusA